MHGLYLMWWVQERHVPVTAVAAVLAAGDFAVTALEVPTGWLADRYGYRRSLIAGSVLQVGGMLVALVGRGALGVLISCLLIAAGDAFRSGADQALLFRSCVAAGRESEFQPIEARTRGIQLVALVLMVLAGGAIVEAWGFSAGWLIETALCATGLAIACAMIEPPQAHQAGAAATSSREAAACGPSASSELAGLLPLIVPASLLDGFGAAAAFVAQTAADTTPMRMTLVVASMTLAEAAGAMAGGRLTGGIRAQLTMAGAGLAIAAVPVAVTAAFLPSLLTLCFLMGVSYPLRAGSIQRLASDPVRARAASVASACDKVATTLALIGAGMWR